MQRFPFEVGCFWSLPDLYCLCSLCVRWGRDRLGNYPCLMNTKIRIWLKSTEMAPQQVRSAPGELWAAQIYPQALLKKNFLFLNQHSCFFWAEVASTQGFLLPSSITGPGTDASWTTKGLWCFYGVGRRLLGTDLEPGHGPDSPWPVADPLRRVRNPNENHCPQSGHVVYWKGP